MPWEVVKRQDTLFGSDHPFVSILPHHIGFNAAFSRLAELSSYKRVTIYADTQDRRLGFEFHNDEREDSLSLTQQSGSKKGQKRSSMMCSAVGVLSQFDWVKSVANLDTTKDRRFTPKKEGKRWVIQLCPAFETRKSRDSKDIPSDATGIYRYRRETGEIAYIGRGEIKKRLSSPERKDWEFSIVEYSIVEDPDERLRWEDFWIERFREDNGGRLPIYNKISGTSPNE